MTTASTTAPSTHGSFFGAAHRSPTSQLNVLRSQMYGSYLLHRSQTDTGKDTRANHTGNTRAQTRPRQPSNRQAFIQRPTPSHALSRLPPHSSGAAAVSSPYICAGKREMTHA